MVSIKSYFCLFLAIAGVFSLQGQDKKNKLEPIYNVYIGISEIDKVLETGNPLNLPSGKRILNGHGGFIRYNYQKLAVPFYVQTGIQLFKANSSLNNQYPGNVKFRGFPIMIGSEFVLTEYKGVKIGAIADVGPNFFLGYYKNGDKKTYIDSFLKFNFTIGLLTSFRLGNVSLPITYNYYQVGKDQFFSVKTAIPIGVGN